MNRVASAAVIDGGQMGDLIRAFDWAATPLGPIERWPQSLRSVLSVCLGSSFPSIVWWGPEHRLLYNDACIPIFGSVHTESLGQPGVAPTLEARAVNAQDAFFVWSYSPIRDEGGGVGGVFGIAAETTERFRIMADAAPVMIWQSDVTKQCTYFNKPWLDFTGRALAQELGSGWSNGVHPEDIEQCIATYIGAFDARRNFEIEYRLRRYDGEYRWIIDRGTPMYAPGGSFAGYIGGCIDITDRKQSELAKQLDVVVGSERLRQQLEAEQRERLLDDERRRIADELRDHAAQTFFVIGLVAAAALAELNPDRVSEPVASGLAEVGELAKAGAEHLRNALSVDNAEVVGRGVVPALGRLVRGIQQRTSIDADLVVTGPQRRLPTEVAETLHAVCREALVNVERHSQASAVVVGLTVGRRSVMLSIQDDGSASSLSQVRTADRAAPFGLGGVGERVRRLGGTFIARPARHGGFVVRTRIPLTRAASV